MKERSSNWHGGHLYSWETPEIPPGYRMGDGVFETVRTYDGKPFQLRAHLMRLLKGARLIGLENLASLDALEDEVDRSLRVSRKAAQNTEWIIRPAIFSDGSYWGFVVSVEPWTPPSSYAHGIGLAVGVSSYPHPGHYLTPQSSSVSVKWLSRGPLAHSLREARRRGWDEALLLDQNGNIIEGTRSNIIVVKNDTLISPGPNSGALPGITRETVMECAVKIGIQITDRPISAVEFNEAGELFLTSTLLGIAPIFEANGRLISKEQVMGEATKSLEESFKNKICAETGVCP